MFRPVQKIAPLLFFSGACALIYQTVWLRELRLVFGASTSASAAVLAMFMGGLGAGGLVLGKRIDQKKNPLTWYANLELGVAALTAVTPFLTDGARYLYSALGGTALLGTVGGTLVRLLLSAIVLVPVTFLMGGTLPAAARAAESEDDPGRRDLATLYGVNTLGAVVGALTSTFILLEVFGGRLLLWMICLLNALLAVIARGIARGLEADAEEARAKEASTQSAKEEETEEKKPTQAPAVLDVPLVAPPRFVLASAAVVGFAFLLMELVFYRMLGPILGGSSYTFGLILVFALLGVGLGGAVYPWIMRNRSPSLRAFALTCLLEAFFLLLPFALGDRIALLALTLRPLKALGFYGLASGWAVITAIVVLPAAFVSGVQFPLLMALLGQGQKKVGEHVGLAYAWNTVGSIVGSLAGGFGLIPWLGAPGVWRLSALLLVFMGTAAAILFYLSDKKGTRLVWPAIVVAACVLLAIQVGPTAGWRHTPIGAGRSDARLQNATPNTLRDWFNHERRVIHWEADGIESSVAVNKDSGYKFVVNGKVDGHSRVDAGTQVMSGLIAALLHPKPTRALVVGLGTGSTAGWLGAVPEMERVDAVELEPAILRVARDCAPINQNVLDNPKVKISTGDAREVLLTTKNTYDIVVSEPSNPYRAGIASLFTQEVYQAVAKRLAPGGIFLQWMQAYEVDGQTVRIVYATLASVFPNVQTWLSQGGDLVLVASVEPTPVDVETIRRRLSEEPYKTAVTKVWRVFDVEGVLSHFLAAESLAKVVYEQEKGNVNTDDRNMLEFSFARTVGKRHTFDEREILEAAVNRKEDRPRTIGKVDSARIDDLRMAMFFDAGREPPLFRHYTNKQLMWMEGWNQLMGGNFALFKRLWEAENIPPRSVYDLSILAAGYAETADEKALAAIDALRVYQPVEADVCLARYLLKKGEIEKSAEAAMRAITVYQSDPWPTMKMVDGFLETTVIEIAMRNKVQGARLFEALAEPFVMHLLDEERLRARVRLSQRIDFAKHCREAYSAFEPHIPFKFGFLRQRAECYGIVGDPKKAQADRDFQTFLDDEPITFRAGLDENLDYVDDPAAKRLSPGAGQTQE
ncbi:MAG: fused MFS/spermidine synthase [Polyangiaceae bacterium]|nr:fused MFS/spermidine synthase [Polyangiaceae bacterium]